MKKAFFSFVLLSAVSVSAFANIGGANYNTGSYACEDSDGELSSSFKFKSQTAEFEIKGVPVSLSCSPAREDLEGLSLFPRDFRIVDICRGNSEKGQVVTGTSNSMGIVQMRALLLDKQDDITARGLLNCSSKPTSRTSGW